MTKYDNLCGFKNIDAFVAHKLDTLESLPKTYDSLFSMMFAESDNVLWERTNGYKIEKRTYREAKDRILRRAATLSALLADVPAGSVVGLSMANGPDWIELFWSVLLCGFRPLLINLRLDDASVASVLSRADARAVITDQKHYAVRTIPAEEIVCAAEPLPARPCGETVLLMSSGTSLNVKICAYGAEQFYHQLRGSFGIIKECALMKKHYQGELKLLTFLPFYHIFGLAAVYVWFTFFSRTLVFLNDLNPQTITNTVKKHKVTHIFAVPLFWEKVYAQTLRGVKDRGEKTEKKLKKGLRLAQKPLIGPLVTRFAFRELRAQLFGDSICFMISGGSMIDPKILLFFNCVGYHLANGFGSTEIGITSVELDKNGKHLLNGSVGKPMCSIEYRLNEENELLVRGDATALSVTDEYGTLHPAGGWFNTHDLAEMRDGHYYLLGRKDDLVIGSSGENLNPNVLEQHFMMSGISGACLIADTRDAVPVPTLLLSVSRYCKAERLREISAEVKAVMDREQLNGQIGRIVYVTAPLMTETDFKLNRTRIRRDYLAGLFPVITPETAESTDGLNTELADKILSFFSAALGHECTSYYTDFFTDEGGTSLDYFAMISQLQQEFQVSFPSEQEKTLSTVADLCRHVEKQV